MSVTWAKGEDGIAVVTLDDPGRSANTMDDRYVAAMGTVVDELAAADIVGVIVTSAKKTFFAGGDLDSLSKAGPADAPQVLAKVTEVKAQLRKLETLGKPVVAAMNGTALGGGLEIGLACHHRIAVDDDKVKLGLPEVTLGLLPGGGGVTRLVRMLGITEALMGWLLQGQQRSPAEAHAKGVVDDLVATREELVPAAKAWIREHGDDESAAVDVFFAAGYTYDDAVALGTVWNVDPWEAKVTGGGKLLAGETLPVAP